MRKYPLYTDAFLNTTMITSGLAAAVGISLQGTPEGRPGGVSADDFVLLLLEEAEFKFYDSVKESLQVRHDDHDALFMRELEMDVVRSKCQQEAVGGGGARCARRPR